MDAVKIGIAAEPGEGKSTVALFPDEPDQKVLLIATNAVAAKLRGIPRSWIDGRVTVELAGFNTSGQRETGGSYYKKMMGYAAKPRPEFTRIVVDDITTMVRCHYNDILLPMGGLPSEYRRENEAPQQFGFAFMEQIWQANTGAQIIALHHTKKINRPGADKVLDTHWFELVGSKLDDSWAGRFDGFFFMDSILAKDNKNPRLMTVRRRLHLTPGGVWKFVINRHGLGEPTFPAMVDVTVNSEKDTQPLKNAWLAMDAATGGDVSMSIPSEEKENA